MNSLRCGMWFLLLFTFSIAVEITQLKDYSISGTMAIMDSVNQTKCVAKKGGKKRFAKTKHRVKKTAEVFHKSKYFSH